MAANGNVKINVEYDNKPVQDLIKQFNDMNQPIKTASNAIAGMVEDLKKSGQSTKEANQRLTDMAKALGQLDTKAKQPRQALSELKGVLVESTDAYKKLTNEEKNSEFGKALKQSIQQITQRAKGMQSTLKEVQTSLGDTSESSKKASISFGDVSAVIGKVSVAIAACSGAFKVLKDALMTSESNVDEWGRTMESAKSLYEGFLSALNTGNISGFLSNIQNIVNAAKDAYNSIDELNTVNTIRSPERARLESRQQELRATIRTKGKDSAEGKAAAAELKTLAPQLKQSYINEGKDNAKAFKEALKEQLTQNGINLSEADLNRLMPTFSNERLFKQFRANAKGSLSKKVVGSGDYEQVQTVDTRNLNQKIMDAVTDEWRQKHFPKLVASMSARGQAASVDLANSRYTKETTSGKGGVVTQKEVATFNEGAVSIKDMQTNISLLKKELDSAEVNSEAWLATLKQLNEWQGKLSNAQTYQKDLTDYSNRKTKPAGIPTETNIGDLSIATSQLKELKKNKNLTGFNLGKEKGANGMDVANTLTSGFSSLNANLSNLGVDLGSGFGDTIGQLQSMLGVIQSIEIIVSAIQAIDTISSFFPFAGGGVVHAANGVVAGHNYIDRVPATLSSGEMVMNEADQSRLWDAIKGGNFGGGGGGRSTISGEQIVTVINAYGRRTGRGEILR